MNINDEKCSLNKITHLDSLDEYSDFVQEKICQTIFGGYSNIKNNIGLSASERYVNAEYLYSDLSNVKNEYEKTKFKLDDDDDL